MMHLGSAAGKYRDGASQRPSSRGGVDTAVGPTLYPIRWSRRSATSGLVRALESKMSGRVSAAAIVWLACILPAVSAANDAVPTESEDKPGQESAEAPATPGSTSPSSSSSTTRLTDEELAARRQRSQRNRELLSVEQDVSGLKERVFRSKATLRLLKELVIEGATIGSRASIWLLNDLSGAYSIESIQFFLNGKAVFSRTDPSGGLDNLGDVEIHAQTLPPGAHTLQVNMVLRGKGYGVFSYVQDYSFRVQSSYGFTVEDGKITVVKSRLRARGGPFTSFVDRPDLSYTEVRESLRGE